MNTPLGRQQRGVAINWTNFPDGFGGTTASTWKFYEYATEGYQQNPVVYACIRLISEASSDVRIVLKESGEIISDEEGGKEFQKVIAFLKRPNPYQSMPEFVSAWSIYMQLAGISFIRGANIGTRPGGMLEPEYKTGMQMRLIRPDKMQIETDKYGDIVDFKYTTSGVKFPPEEIMFTLYPDPLHEFAGQSPMRAAARSIDSHSNAIEWNRNLLRKGGIPLLVLIIKGLLNLKETERKKYQADYQEQYGGAKNAGKPLILAGESADIKQLSHNALEMDWLAGKTDMMRDICACFGVPSRLLGDPQASTYSNVEEANKAFYQKKILPDMGQFVTELTEWLSPKMGWKSKNIEIGTDTSHIAALNESEDAKFTRANLAGWITINEKRELTGFDDIPDGDVIMVPFSLVPLEGALEPSEPISEPPDDKEGQSKSNTIQKRNINHLSRYKTEEQRVAAWQRVEMLRMREEKKWTTAFKAIFKEQRGVIIDGLKSFLDSTVTTQTVANAPRSHAIPSDYVKTLFDTTGQAEILAAEFEPLLVTTILNFGEDAIAQLKLEGILFDINRPAIQQWITTSITIRSELINQSTADILQPIINNGLDQGWGAEKIADAISDRFTSMSRFRTVAIARTEVVRASTIANQYTYSQIGTEYKEWLSARDGNVRDSHMDMDGQVVKLFDEFVSPLTGARGQGPGLMDSAGDSINCFPGDMRVKCDNIEKIYSRFYDGEVVTIETGRGFKLTATPNHPILTTRGWLGIGEIVEGDNILCDVSRDWIMPGTPNVENPPSALQEIYRTLALKGCIDRISGHVPDFHGDGLNRDINVISADGKLGNGIEPETSETIGDLNLILSDLRSAPEMSPCLTNEFDITGSLSLPSGMSSHCQVFPFIGSHATHSEDVSLTAVAQSNIATLEPMGNNVTGNTEGISEREDGLALQIAIDNIVNVKRDTYSGHIFNLQTVNGWFVTEGIITHNCRCTLVPLMSEEEAI